ncbi:MULTISPECIES: hypothetical protein [Aerosakkonema]|uniref:hypothetical protein n=1 Tax=Aerosakkonema TaxID=1246629 RepID=UPI0035B8DC37
MATSYYSIVIALASLILSMSVAYFAYFRPAKPKMLIGSNLIILNSYLDIGSKRLWGGLSFYVPITFYNWSPKGSSIHQVRIIIGRKDDPTKYFDMVWNTFVEVVKGENRWEDVEIARPIALAAHASISKFIRFDWSPLTGEKIDIQAKEYSLIVLAWVRNTEKPELVFETSFFITEEQSKLYKQTVVDNNVSPILITLGVNQRVNNVMTKDQIKSFYGKGTL